MLVKRKIIEIDENLCTGCGKCILNCHEGAIEIINGKARLISDNLCDGLGACMGGCPENALKIIEKTTESFDEEAVKKHLNKKSLCSSLKMNPFEDKNLNWPLKISLVSLDSEMFHDKDLIVAADCASACCRDFHAKIADGKTVVIGCPKLNNTEEYMKKIKDILLRNKIKSLTVVRMEVPCCTGLETAVKKSVELSGKNIGVKIINISRQGKIF